MSLWEKHEDVQLVLKILFYHVFYTHEFECLALVQFFWYLILVVFITER